MAKIVRDEWSALGSWNKVGTQRHMHCWQAKIGNMIPYAKEKIVHKFVLEISHGRPAETNSLTCNDNSEKHYKTRGFVVFVVVFFVARCCPNSNNITTNSSQQQQQQQLTTNN